LALISGVGASGATLAQSWTSAGVDLSNSHYQAAETQISSKTVPNLKLKWQLATGGDVTAIPAVAGRFVYFPDSAGNIYKVNAKTGAVIWSTQVSSITGVTGDYSRTTPAIIGSMLILGSQSGKLWDGVHDTRAKVFALDANTGTLLWVTIVDQTPQSMVTNSAVIAPGGTSGIAIVGVTSNEELTSAFVPSPYWQWNFRGSVLAIDVATGAIKWQTYTVPPGYFGGTVWGSTAAVDLSLNQVYVGTGNNYMVPQEVLTCLAGGGGAACMDPADHADSIIALDLTTGAIKWAGSARPDDAWSAACGLVIPGLIAIPSTFFSTPGIYGNCPDPSGIANPNLVGPDYDFGQGPMLFSDTGSSDDKEDIRRDKSRALVGAGAKSGIFWAFRAKDGKKVWSRQVSPGGVTGGMQWGSATDGTTLYVSASNAGPPLNGGGVGAGPWTLVNGQVVYSGGWAAVDAATGKVKWTTPDPSGAAIDGARAEGPVTLANGVVFGCNMQGTMFALNAKSGAQLWQYGLPIQHACTAGAAIVNGMVFWGSGDGHNSPNAAKKLFAFGL
jgi:polyvinyl alcohol dehydrogenase (cytochrome)